MQRQVEELKRKKAEQGSERLQGEVQELALEARLCSAKFPARPYRARAEGEFGGDVLQRVIGPLSINAAARSCGEV